MPARAFLFTALALLTLAVLMFYALMNHAHRGQPASLLALYTLLALIVASMGCAAVGLRQALLQPEASSIALWPSTVFRPRWWWFPPCALLGCCSWFLQ